MDIAAGSDLRLGFLLLLNGIVALSAWQFVRRATEGDWLDRAADAGVLFYLVQYLAVCVPGVCGGLGPISMAGTAVGLCVVMWVGALLIKDEGRRMKDEGGGDLGWVPRACLAFVVGYVGALVVYYRHLPVISNDALTYHFPAAAQWLRTGRVGIFETWFFNPANAYSPLAGSAFVAWLMAPLGNDTVASFVQAPALVVVWLVAVRLGREVGLGATVAALAGTVVVVAQPFIRAAVLSKDDLFVAMFFVAAVAGCSRRLMGDRLGAWRVGVAVGLLLATKYTALLCVPILLLGADGPVKAGWGWRRWVVAVGCVLAVAGPWYGRNWVGFGNPVFPVRVGVLGHTVLPGLMTAEVSPKLRSVAGIWRVFTGVDDALPASVLLVVLAGWVAFGVRGGRRVLGGPVGRVVALGPVVGVGLFLWKAPYAEVRFLYPVLVLMVVGFAGGVVGWGGCAEPSPRPSPGVPGEGGRGENPKSETRNPKRGWGREEVGGAHPTGEGRRGDGVRLVGGVRKRCVGVGLVVGLLVLAALTGLPILHGMLLLPVGVGAGVVVAVGGIVVARRGWDWTHAVVAGVVMAAGVAGAVYVYWPAYVRQSAGLAVEVWERKYGAGLAGAWGFVRQLPAGEKVAYANTYLVYPLMGFEPTRPVEYLPARRGVRRLADLPDLGAVNGEEMVVRVARVTNADPAEGEWLERLGASGAKYLYVEKRAGVPAAPELGMAERHPGRFRAVYDSDAARVYEIR